MISTVPTATTERFLEALASGTGVPAEVFSPDAVLDATVPGWRFPLHGATAVAEKFGVWFADPGSFEELERHAFEGGETVTYTFSWTRDGVPHAVHHCHVLTFGDDGRIARVRFWCGGQWDAALLAEMAAAHDAD